jgi:hypothetical protein
MGMNQPTPLPYRQESMRTVIRAAKARLTPEAMNRIRLEAVHKMKPRAKKEPR